MTTNQGGYSRRTVDVREVHSNVDQKIIQITEDRLKLILNEHLSLLEKKNSWIAPLGILITLIVVFSTTTFKQAFFAADTWQAFFLITTILTVAWLLKSLWIAFKSETVTDLLSKIKSGDGS